MGWFKKLSKMQRLYGIMTLVISILIMLAGVILQPPKDSIDTSKLTVDMSIRQIAPVLGITGKSLARDLGLPLIADKDTPLSQHNISAPVLSETLDHILSHTPSTLKYYLMTVLALWGFVFLVIIGRPNEASVESRASWYPRGVHLFTMIIALGVCGFLMGKSPNPMESIVKVFKSMVGLYPDPLRKVLAFFLFIGVSIIGNKLICGWSCPFGALQELIYSIPGLSKSIRLPRWLTATIRLSLFAAMLLILFGIIGGKKGFVIYHYVNPFNIFNLDFDYLSITVAVGVTCFVGLIIYRPFCQLICPFGLVSWFAEKISIHKVRIDHEKCISCGACSKACPTASIKDKINKKTMPSDCFSCGRCLNKCPVDAISYGRKK